MNKTQTKKEAKKLLQKLLAINEELRDVQEEVRDFISEVEEVRDSIEPYEGKCELTPAQEERQEWCDELISKLEEVTCMDIEDTIYDLDGFLDN